MDSAKIREENDLANTRRQQAETVRVLVDVGFSKDAAVKAVTSNDLNLLTQS